MDRGRKLALLRQALKQPGKALGHDEYAFFCPHHGSRPDRQVGQLGANVATDKWHCYSCGRGGATLLFLFPFKSPEWEEYRASLPDFKPEGKKKDFEDVVLPDEFRTLSKEWHGPYYNKAMSYLADRGIGMEDIIRWKLGYCEDGRYKHRIIIPSFNDQGFLNFITGRAFYDGMTRYWNGNFCKDIVFNDYMVDWKKPVFVTEGPFDAFKIGPNAIALQGSLLSKDTLLFSKLVLSGVDVYLALDHDAFEKTLDIARELISYGVTCMFVPLGGKKDVGEMTKAEFVANRLKSIPLRSEMDTLRLHLRVHS